MACKWCDGTACCARIMPAVHAYQHHVRSEISKNMTSSRKEQRRKLTEEVYQASLLVGAFHHSHDVKLLVRPGVLLTAKQ